MKILITALVSVLSLVAFEASARNLHLIEQDTASGFAIYRLGAPDPSDMKELCALGVSEIMVLSGNADKYEFKNAAACPTLKVIYNHKQNAKKPLTAEFLEGFDQWIAESQSLGKKIAFRCSCGCHRTGRLAAYYQMKYQGLTSSQAIAVMMNLGKWMFIYPGLDNQVRALEDYIAGEKCGEKKKWCVRLESNSAGPEVALGTTDDNDAENDGELHDDL